MQDQNTHSATKRLIFLAAKKEFAEKGLQGARIGSIADRAGVRQSLIHYHFGSKEQLYAYVLKNLSLIFEQSALADFLDKQALTPPEKLYLSIYYLVNIHLEVYDPDYNRLIAHEIASGLKHFHSIIRETILPNSATITKIIRDGVATGDFISEHIFLDVMMLLVFITHYEQAHEILEGSSLFTEMFDGDYKKRLLDFTLDRAFKCLRPLPDGFKIPVPPENALRGMDSLINEIKRTAGFQLFGSDNYTIPGEAHA